MNQVSPKDINVCHSIPGRLRVKVASLRFNPERCSALEHWLAQQSEVKKAEIHAHTGSVLLFYNPEKVAASSLLDLLAQGMKVLARVEIPPSPGRARPREETCSSQIEQNARALAAGFRRLGPWVSLATWLVTGNPLRAFTVMLVMACPCGPVLAASLAFAAAKASAARRRILIKESRSLVKVGKADAFCFHHPETLSSPFPQVVEVVPRLAWEPPARVLGLAATAELHQDHPLAQAIRVAAENQGVLPQTGATCEKVPGRGIRAQIGEDTILVGNSQFMEEEGVPTSYFRKKADSLSETGHTLLYVARNRKAQGLIALAPRILPEAGAVLEWLRQDGVSGLFLATEKGGPEVRVLIESLPWDEFRLALRPEGKASYVEALVAEGRQVASIGKAEEDALALSKASVGIATGIESPEAIPEEAGIALLEDELQSLVTLRQLSHRTQQVIEENWQMVVSSTVIAILFGTAGLLSPVMAGALHLFHILGILANCSRLVGWTPPGLSEKGEKVPRSREKQAGKIPEGPPELVPAETEVPSEEKDWDRNVEPAQEPIASAEEEDTPWSRNVELD